jgi:hypothetical protein
LNSTSSKPSSFISFCTLFTLRRARARKAAWGCSTRSWFISTELSTSGISLSMRMTRKIRSRQVFSADWALTQLLTERWVGMAARNFLATFSMSSTSRMSTNWRAGPSSPDPDVTDSRGTSCTATAGSSVPSFSDFMILRLSSSFLKGLRM